jgi:hypothetical protein
VGGLWSGFRRILSILGGLVGLLGLSVASQKMAQAARTLHPQPSIYLVGPAAAGKTTLFRYLRQTPQPDESTSTGVRRRTGRLAADFSESRLSWFRSTITDDGLGRQTNQWVGRLKYDNPEGIDPPNITRKERPHGLYHSVAPGRPLNPHYPALVGGHRPLIAPAGGGQGRGTSSAAWVQADRRWVRLGNSGSRVAMDPKRTPRCPCGGDVTNGTCVLATLW